MIKIFLNYILWRENRIIVKVTKPLTACTYLDPNRRSGEKTAGFCINAQLLHYCSADFSPADPERSHRRQPKNALNRLECFVNKDFKAKGDGVNSFNFKKIVLFTINKQK